MYIFIKLVLAAFINFYQFIYLFFPGLISPFCATYIFELLHIFNKGDKNNNKDLMFICMP